jgi:GNAT superfamily N-acetyltransferase
VSTERRWASLTLDNLDDLLKPCRSCVFWELDPVAGRQAYEAGDPELEKEAWVSATLLRWGSCGTVVYQGSAPVGYALYAPPSFLPRSATFPTSPISADALQLIAARVHPDERGHGLGRALVQSAARDLARRGARALEAFGDARTDPGNCLLPADFLLAVGFKTVRPHHHWPRLRLDLRSMVTLTAEVEAALDRIIGVVRPEPALRPV